jgi:hypothetical protein
VTRRWLAAACFGAALAGCADQTELLAPLDLGVQRFAFCPTTIDVYGGLDVLLPGCFGAHDPPASIPDGVFMPGDPLYDASLAGRLQERVAADPDLLPGYGSSWTVRVCGAPFADLTALAPPLAADECGLDEPPRMGLLTDLCANSPAPLMLLLLDGTADRCHGGGPDSMEPDDETTYDAHVAARLQALLDARQPSLALVGPRTEWRPAPQVMAPDVDRCSWTRGDWDRGGLDAWRSAHPDDGRVLVEPDLHDESKRHNACCATLFGPAACELPWYGSAQMGGGGGSGSLNCDGAQAVVDFWYQRLKQLLLTSAFTCP